MYLPAHFAEERPEALHELMRAYPLCTLVVSARGQLEANSVPLLLDAERGPHGTLVGHVARGNPLWRHIEAAADGELGALAVFHGPQAYITPNWYASKKTDGKVVPTWNYISVHAHGLLRTRHEPEWLLALVNRLTDVHEAGGTLVAGGVEPWRVADAPEEYIRQMLRAIVGIEMTLTGMQGKWKVSQNRGREDQLGVAAGLEARDAAAGGTGATGATPAAAAMAAAVRQRARD